MDHGCVIISGLTSYASTVEYFVETIIYSKYVYSLFEKKRYTQRAIHEFIDKFSVFQAYSFVVYV